MFKVAGPLWAQATAGGDNIFARLVKTGKQVLRRVLQKTEPTAGNREIPKPTWSLRAQTVQFSESSTARLVGGLFPKQVLKTQAAEARRRAALRFIRDSRKVPVFAFVGLSLGASLEQQRNSEDDTLCSGIRDLFKQYGVKQSAVDEAGQLFSLETLQLGQLIGKGCNAAVYEARPLSSCLGEESSMLYSCSVPTPVPELSSDQTGSSVDPSEEDLPPAVFRTDDYASVCDDTDEEFVIISDDEDGVRDVSSDVSSSATSLDAEGWMMYRVPGLEATETTSDADSDIFILAGDEDGLQSMPDLDDMGLEWLRVGPPDTLDEAGVCASDLHSASDTTASSELSSSYSLVSLGSSDSSGTLDDPEPAPNLPGYHSGVPEYPLAVKMMFNYNVESQADRILTAMAKEAVPVPASLTDHGMALSSLQSGIKKLPPHPNIVAMFGVFVDNTPELPGAKDVYPSALPPRLNSESGLGRNATMFLVMKKYNMTMREYLASHTVDTRTRCLLFAQLLEGLVHLGNHSIAHRDLKSDNILVDLSQGPEQPFLVISDFGCCLADEEHGLKLPYTSRDLDRGGNCALMAPEIKTAVPGKHSVLDYTKADLWAAGALAFEIFGQANPFYHSLDARTYNEEDLPSLPGFVPSAVQKLVKLMLKRDPTQRPSPSAAATAMQLYLWAPSNLQPLTSESSSSLAGTLWKLQELKPWLEQVALETVCLRAFGGRESWLDLVVKTTFLKRVSRCDVAAVATLDDV